MRMPMLAIAALAMSLTPAAAQTVLTVPDRTPNAEVTGQTAEPVPSAQQTEPAAPVPALPPEQARAPEPTPPAAPTRYSFNRVDDGFLRLDSQTGQVAFCSPRGAGWACQIVPEDRAAFEQEIARLQDAVAGLRQELADLREPPRPPADLSPAPPSSDKGNDVTIKLPTQEDIDRAGAAIQQAWRRLVDMLVSFRNDMMRKG